MRVWQYISFLLAGLLLMASGAAAVPDAAQAASVAGREAFAQGDYDAALEHFLAARKGGLDAPQLTYNLGVTYYRLARYPRARAEFERLLADASLAPNAHYNLGLVALKENDARRARAHFQMARDSTDSESLRALAARALASTQAPPRARHTGGMVSLGVGYDSNVALVQDTDQVQTRDEGDGYAEFLAGVRHSLGETLDLDAGIYARRYRRVDEFDQSSLRLGLMNRVAGEVWRKGVGAHLDRLYVNGDEFQTVATLTLEGVRALPEDGELRVRYRPSRIEAKAPYDYLTGWRHRGDVQGAWPLGTGRLTVAYEVEFNDRDDLPRSTDFASRSPTRNGIIARLFLPLDADWGLTLAGRYRHSRYGSEHLGPQQMGISRRRVDEEYEMELQLDRKLSHAWYLVGRYVYTDNASTDAAFDYARHETMLSMERVF